MQCSSCGAQIPVGAAFCPNCGKVTQYQMSDSSVTPDTPTALSSSPHTPPYQSSTYSPLNPYEVSVPPPPPPPPQRRRLSVGRAILLIILVLLLVGAGSALYFGTILPSSQTQTQATATVGAQRATATAMTARQGTATAFTTAAQQATATAFAQTPQGMYNQATGGIPILDDPLSTNDTNNWTEGPSSDGMFSCAFTGGAYHASEQPKNNVMLCVAQATNFSNLTYQVQMTIVKGELGGIVFRTDSSQTKYYSFLIDRYGAYKLITSVDNTGTRDQFLRQGTSAFIKTGLNRPNLLTVIASGSSIYLYINKQYVISASDSTYSSGSIGVFGGNYTMAPADVVFSHAQVWSA